VGYNNIVPHQSRIIMTRPQKYISMFLITTLYVLTAFLAYTANPPKQGIPPTTTMVPPSCAENVQPGVPVCLVPFENKVVPGVPGEVISFSAAGIIAIASSAYLAALIFILTRKKKT